MGGILNAWVVERKDRRARRRVWAAGERVIAPNGCLNEFQELLNSFRKKFSASEGQRKERTECVRISKQRFSGFRAFQLTSLKQEAHGFLRRNPSSPTPVLLVLLDIQSLGLLSGKHLASWDFFFVF